MKTLELYKKDTKGKIRKLEIAVTADKLIQMSGMCDDDGVINKPVTHSKVCKAKNVGKVNSTTPEQQAQIEAMALYNIKRTEGYFDTINEAENEEVTMPMLAKTYEKEAKKINWSGDVFIQPKLDGMRCLAIIKDNNVTLLSRKNKPIETMGHIKEELEGLPDMILDGELYVHGESFQENMKKIKRYVKGESEKISFHVYDMVMDKSFIERFSRLSIIGSAVHYEHIQLVPTMRLVNPNIIATYHSRNINDGYEGSMIRHGNAPYKINGRSDQLLKYKEFLDMDCIIQDIEPADARPEWGVPIFNLNGKTFRAGVKMSHEDREELLSNKDRYIGQTAEIRYFEDTDDGIPRFPVMVGIRLDK